MVLFSGTIPLIAEIIILSFIGIFKLSKVDFKNAEGTAKTK